MPGIVAKHARTHACTRKPGGASAEATATAGRREPAERARAPKRSNALRACRSRTGAVSTLAALAALLAGCTGDVDTPTPAAAPGPRGTAYVGGQACAGCHAEQSARWSGSEHSRAMQAATEETVLGRFDGDTYTYDGTTSTFSRRDGEFWVRTDGPEGSLEDDRIDYTFGVEPLQQYLVAFPRGAYQALSIAWDTRPASQGGQRWFHLYPGLGIDHDDPLHWTGPYQRWNTMCAECHSTNLVKNYSPAEDRFATTWTSIDVDCEACHGPGRAHVAAPRENALALGHRQHSWALAADQSTAVRSPQALSDEEAEVCASCHSRRGQLTDDYAPGEPYLDGFRPDLLDAGLYHPDGQILDEVYVYGSFLQSRMHAAGVSCSDCHDPHSATLLADGNALCGRCHNPSVFDRPEHHHHEMSSPGAQCVNCHMRSKRYMVVDPRRDHSFRVPRPDLSLTLGTPNACGDCHDERGPEWAAAQIAEWYPGGRSTEFHYGQALYAGRSWAADRAPLLGRVIEDQAEPAIVRATALGLLAAQIDDRARDLIEKQLQLGEPWVELAALDALTSLAPAERVRLGQRFLTHDYRALRIAAARALLPARDLLGQSRQNDLDRALAEYLDVQEFNSDRAEGLLNIGSVRVEQGRLDEAESVYTRAIARFPGFAAAYVNLADLYRLEGREPDAKRVLEDGLRATPAEPSLSLALGFSLVRSGDLEAALGPFERAADQDAPNFAYVYGVALNEAGQAERAIEVLEAAAARYPGYAPILVALTTILRDAGDIERALEHARRLLALAPTDATARALVSELEATAAR